LLEEHSEISKFQNSEFSNDTVTSSGISCHNFSISNFITMEADCKDSGFSNTTSSSCKDMAGIRELFTLLLTQITSQNQSIKEQIMHNDLKFTQEFQQVVDAHMDFKQEVCEELDELRLLLSKHQSASYTSDLLTSSSVMNNPVTPGYSSNTFRSPKTVSYSQDNQVASQGSSSSNIPDMHNIMLMLTDSFTKLSTVLTDKTSESKSEWPKFSGDVKKFRSWYLAILAQISLPPWQELYDPILHDVVSSSTNQAEWKIIC